VLSALTTIGPAELLVIALIVGLMLAPFALGALVLMAALKWSQRKRQPPSDD